MLMLVCNELMFNELPMRALYIVFLLNYASYKITASNLEENLKFCRFYPWMNICIHDYLVVHLGALASSV